MSDIRIPQCYRRPLNAWLRSEFGLKSEVEAYGYASAMGLFISPAITMTHIVFAICRKSDDKMVHAIKLDRDHEKDASFVRRALTLANG